MMRLSVYDGGTQPVVGTPRLPGCGYAYYRDSDYEEDPFWDRRAEQNEELRNCTPWPYSPWPELMPRHVWADFCSRYEAEGDDGLRLNLYQHDLVTESFELVPAGEGRLLLQPDEILAPDEGRFLRELTVAEIQEDAVNPHAWYRLPLPNETGAPDLRAPVEVVFGNLVGPAFRLELPDNSLFAPFDLRLGLEGYSVLDQDGVTLSDAEAALWFDLTQPGRWSLYLRPRRWRWVVFVIAHFIMVTPFEEYPNDEYFLRSYFDRPPTYPYRHDVIHTSQETPLQDFYGDPRSYDIAIDWAFSSSRAGGELAHEILSSQYTMGPCAAYIYTGHELPDITLWRHPPRVGEIVCGLGRRDADGSESRVWIVQREDATSRYPATVIGQYLSSMWQVEV